MSSKREWMYGMRTNKDGTINSQFQQCVDYFLDFAYKNAKNIEGETVKGVRKLLIRCPCKACKNRFYKTRGVVDFHLTSQGFMKDYLVWYAHGESDEPMDVGQCSNPKPSQHVGQDVDEDLGEYTEFDQMIMECMHQDPNKKAQAFYHMLEQANEPLWEGAKDASTLSATTRLLNWKSDCNVSDSAFDKLLPIIKYMLPDDNKLPVNFYETKKMLKLLELPSQQIHVCQNHCMLFYGQHSDLDRCIVCNERRYKERGKKVPKLVMYYMPIGPRLQRLFYSKKTAQHLTWHADRSLSEKMSHPSEGRAWHHFNSVFPDFAKETRNIRLGLCTDGFCPNNTSGTSYSCWPVFITVYNLPPWLALKEKYVQMPLLIPGPNNPTQNIDVFLQPLVDELKMLFTHGIETYDAHGCNNFQMKAALLWTVSDFPAYAMLSGWSTHGKLACPYCSNKSGSFQLHFGGKPCWFDCHRQHLPTNHAFRKDKINFRKNKTVSGERDIPEPTGEEIWQDIKDLPIVYDVKPCGIEKCRKPPGFGITHNWVKRSIFWELPYWGKLLIRHNLDVMHIEKNVFENLFNTIMGTGYTKDNMKARQDMEQICHRPLLNPKCDKNGNMTKDRGDYTLKKDDVKKVCVWLKKLKFPDGYASNIGSCVNMKVNSFHSFKSHDCHVFMQRLLPLAIRGFVSKDTYEAVTELCMFFRVLCSRTLHVDDLVNMKRDIVQTICKLEKVFPPGFFDSMEHLVIHLANEALLGGPVQYRWMYQYERKLGYMKRRIRNKSKIEGSIVREHLVNELATYCSLYFDPSIETRHNREPRNFAPQHPSSLIGGSQLSVFVVPSRRLYQKGGKRRRMSKEELKKAHTYVLLNCEEVYPYIDKFDEVAPQLYPDEPVSLLRDHHFAEWFENYIMNGLIDGSTRHLEVLAREPSMYAQSHSGYFVNGYKFHTREHSKGLVTSNFGVCVRGETYNAEESDYYGLLDEILELQYDCNVPQTVVLFKCTWFDNKRGVVVNKNKLVDVNQKFQLQSDDHFILASQAEQVFYTPYHAITRDTKDLWAVVKTKARHIYEVTDVTNDRNTEAHDYLQTDERYEVPNDESNSGTLDQDTFYDDDDDDDDEMVYSDHSSDEDEHDC
ncbi:uncharacterized protein LOC110887964 [Helianthus annuus]|uniref:uncharacterized protein LOC110887964 n=1 Tax=Helianthus annuus TaxID=4232 RepID=UPI000B906070|nr:uncharacterized protein LOC110887964 [Helianthus annuus]